MRVAGTTCPMKLQEVADGKTSITKNEDQHYEQLTLKDKKIADLSDKVR